jgi:quercetin dioxygenase-like cupin family protein
MIFRGSAIAATQAGEGVERKLMGFGRDLMMTEVAFKKGGVGSLHAHAEHEQISYIISGSFEVTVGASTAVLSAGDAFLADKGQTHGVVALEDSVILDVFTPLRKDFL